MKSKKLFLMITVIFIIFSCFIAQSPVFAADDQPDDYIYAPETDDEMSLDEPMDVQEEDDMNYDDTDEQGSDDDAYIEDEISDEPEDESAQDEEQEASGE